MSNRLIQIGRIPLIPDPYVAIKASEAFSISRAQTERVVAMGTAYFSVLLAIRNGISQFVARLERALQIRNLSAMTDQSLADIGVRRDQLPQFYDGSGFDNMTGKRPSVESSDSER